MSLEDILRLMDCARREVIRSQNMNRPVSAQANADAYQYLLGELLKEIGLL